MPISSPHRMFLQPRLAPSQPGYAGAEAAWYLDALWREGGDTYVEGWIHTYEHRIEALRFKGANGAWVRVDDLRPRPDLLTHYPMLADGGARAGFSVYLPGVDTRSVDVDVVLEAGTVSITVPLPASRISPANDAEKAEKIAAEAWFIQQVNDGRLEILELGARIVGPWSESWRSKFPDAGRYIGFDIHGGPGVDLVGDAHRLSHEAGAQAFDAVFSVAVLEHLAMPWAIAAEVNRTLRTGGLAYIVTVQSWPVHERPNDFWRFTDEALRLLFGPLHGFEVIDAGMCQRLRIYPEDRAMNDPRLPLHPGFGLAWVLSRKVSEVATGDTAPELPQLRTLSERYPEHRKAD